MENKLIEERIDKFIEFLECTDVSYILITLSSVKGNAFIKGKEDKVLGMLTYGLNCIVQDIREQRALNQKLNLSKEKCLKEATDLKQAVDLIITEILESEQRS